MGQEYPTFRCEFELDSQKYWIILSSNPDDAINPSINRVAYLATPKLSGRQAGLVVGDAGCSSPNGVSSTP
ncbi:hypothetical protein K435DRAFT_868335 [Dendrothele bispora CBS 962.96]|uniref:Uncharacterized protein n=1 Tax=Dendrothele bispora (strain CBS 962.96) TaxID=1314807 RepID=A0A4S8LC00_DENBC|nr:hypothetical protein K435DRAFT_868335 [Dendrothele bispora CBS 962.96]